MTDSSVTTPERVEVQVVPAGSDDPGTNADLPFDDGMAASRDSFPASDPPSSWWGGAGDRAYPAFLEDRMLKSP